MNRDKGFQNLGDLFHQPKQVKPAAPAYVWQDLALRIIDDLKIPNFKRNSVFKICKDHQRSYVEKCLDETKELCQEGECWKYFFKVVSENKKDASEN